MSRAACSASVASLAWSEPTCLCARPLRLRMKTSHNGVFGVVILISCEFICGLRRSLINCGLRRSLAALAFLGIGLGCLAHPCAFFMRLAPRCQPVAVAGAVA